MSSRFTEFVRSLGEEADRELFAAVWSELRTLLRSELKKRGLWDSPPSYLGVHGSAQLKIKPNLDGLIRLNVRHFLHERQKEHG